MPKRKLHKLINTIEHKHCGKCDQWKILDQFGKRERIWDGFHNYCKACENKKDKKRCKKRLEKRKKARDQAPTGFLVCLFHGCTVMGMQPVDQFISNYERDEEPTNCCKTCRDKKLAKNKRRYATCQKVWDDWRKTHPCVKCMNDPKHEHNYLLIEADHLGNKLKACSQVGYWSAKCRGPVALKAELKKCQSLCKFHHQLVTQQRRHDNGNILKRQQVLRKRAIINAEKHKRGCCSNSKCERVLKEGEECAFDFDHRDPKTKFIHNGKPYGPAQFVYLSNALFDTQWSIEKELVDLLCKNCHALKTKGNKDGYKT